MAVHTIALTYNLADGKVASDSKGIQIPVGDSLQFVSNAGSVRVLMLPESNFSVAEFRSGDYPLTAHTKGTFRFCCGVTIEGVMIGYPLHRDFGDDGEVVDPGTRTK
ncbi:MAG: hypothetical protein ABJF23_07320 [Bryobacteraceae bacterium]